MIRLSINLPAKHRLDINFVKRRKDLDNTPLLPDLGKIRRIRRGNKISRFFRHIFEHKKLNKILGANLAIIAAATSLIPNPIDSFAEIEENSTVTAPIVLTTEKNIQYPVKNGRLSQGYKFYHPGIDIDSIYAEPVYSITDGVVEAIQYSNSGYGNAIIVDHGSKISSLYAHLAKIYVKTNQRIDKEKVIGTIGATGRATGSHLHLEIRDSGRPLNPLTILP